MQCSFIFMSKFVLASRSHINKEKKNILLSLTIFYFIKLLFISLTFEWAWMCMFVFDLQTDIEVLSDFIQA